MTGKCFQDVDGTENSEDPMAGVAADKTFEPPVELENQEAMAVLERSLQKLPLRQQQAFLLRLREGMSIIETAAAMGCAAGSVVALRAGGEESVQGTGGSLAMSTEQEREQAFVEEVRKTLREKGEKLDPEIIQKLVQRAASGKTPEAAGALEADVSR